MSMKRPKKRYKTIDEYIDDFPKDIQGILKALRQAIRESAPKAEETISYQMPAFRLNGIWCILQLSEIILAFFLLHQVLLHSKKNCLSMKYQKGPLDFHWINQSHWTWLRKL